MLDCSTTCYHLAHELRGRRNLIVVTNGLRSAELLSDSGVTVVLPGGTVRRSSWSLVGDFGDLVTSRGRLAMGFFGIRGLSREHGLMELSVEETTVKRRLAAACVDVYGLFDSSKIGRFALHSFAPAQRITGLFTDEGADPERPGHDPPDETHSERDDDDHPPVVLSATALRTFVIALNALVIARSAPESLGGSIPTWRANAAPS